MSLSMDHDQVAEQTQILLRQMLDAYRTGGGIEAARSLRGRMVEFARRETPYYRSVLTQGELDFEEIPVLTKAIVREHFDELLTPSVPESRRVFSTTSGSTGEPMRCVRDIDAYPAAYAARHFLKYLLGIPEDATTCWVIAMVRKDVSAPPGWHRVPYWGLDAQGLADELVTWARFERYWVYGLASVLEHFAILIETNRLPLPCAPICVVTTSDQLSTRGRDLIGRAFNCPVYSWYGSIEVDPSLATTPPGQPDRYLWNGLHSYLEILDPRGRPVAAGNVGRIVVTDLRNFAFPLIRYDTNDLGRAPEDNQSAFPILPELVGRSSEVISLSGAMPFSGTDLGHCLFVIEHFEKEIRSYQCIQLAPDAVELRVVWAIEPFERLIEDVKAAMVPLVGPKTRVIVRGVEMLEVLPSGKRSILMPLKTP